MTSWDGKLAYTRQTETASGQVVRTSQINTGEDERKRKEVRANEFERSYGKNMDL